MIHVEKKTRKGLRRKMTQIKTNHRNKLGRSHARHIQFKSAKTKNRMRIKEKDIHASGKIYIRDLKKYHVLKLQKVRGTNLIKSSWLNKNKKNMVQLNKKEHGSYLYNCTGYYFEKRYHLN